MNDDRPSYRADTIAPTETAAEYAARLRAEHEPIPYRLTYTGRRALAAR